LHFVNRNCPVVLQAGFIRAAKNYEKRGGRPLELPDRRGFCRALIKESERLLYIMEVEKNEASRSGVAREGGVSPATSLHGKACDSVWNTKLPYLERYKFEIVTGDQERWKMNTCMKRSVPNRVNLMPSSPIFSIAKAGTSGR
jgi:hypothetical protein